MKSTTKALPQCCHPLGRGAKSRIVLATIVVMFVTPGILGSVSGVGNGLLLVGGFITYVVASRPKMFINDLSALIQVLLGVFLLVQATLLGTINDPQPRNYLFYSITATLIGFCLARTLTTSEQVYFFCKCFTFLLLPIALSQVITALLQMAFSVALSPYYSFDTGKLISLGQNLGWVPIAPDIYFPITMGFSHFAIPAIGASLPRDLGYFREPGVYATYLSLSYICWDYVRTTSRYLIPCGKVLTIAALLLTGSTSGLAIFVGIFAYKALMVPRSGRAKAAAFAGLVAAIAITAVLASSDFEEKAVSLYGSDQSRFSSIPDSYQLLLQKPILGFGATAGHLYQANEGINLLSALHLFGIVGLLLYGAIIVSSAVQGFTKETGVVLLVIILTICVSQPLYFDCITFFFLNVRWKQTSRRARSVRLQGFAPIKWSITSPA